MDIKHHPSKQAWTIVELLAATFVIAVTALVCRAMANEYGKWTGIGAGILSCTATLLIILYFYRWSWQREELVLQELKDNYHGIFRVLIVPSDPKIIRKPEGAEIRVGDYGWEAGSLRKDGLTYLQGLTPEWTVVWHAGFKPSQIERVATKPNSQYDYWRPYWADPAPTPVCPFPVIERSTMAMGLPHQRNCYDEPRPYPSRNTDDTNNK